MTDVRIGGAQTYTIPLESVDLTYLSRYVQNPQTERLPLWSKKCLDGETEYYQVQIVTQDVNRDCFSEASDTYKCHICNVHVPIMCYKEHNESDHHETFKNIFEKVLERVSKQINRNIIHYDKDIDEDLYYCVPCCKIVKIQNRYKHESSDYHVKSEEDNNVVKEFYKILKENKNNDDIEIVKKDRTEENNPEPSHSKAYDENNDFDEKYNNFEVYSKYSNSTLDSDDDYSPFAKNLNIYTEPEIDEKNQPSNDVKPNKNESFEEYLEEMIKKYKLEVNVPEVENDFIYVALPNGEKLKVSRENFHSFRQIKDSIYCQLCKMWISQDTKAHETTESHARQIFKPINEKFYRTIDTVSSHCVPCNEVVLTDSNHHTLNDNHKKIVKQMRKSKTAETLCEVCNRYIDSHNFTAHTNGKQHILRQNAVHRVDEYSFSREFCNQTVSKYSVTDHINSTTHITRKTNDSTGINNKSNNSTNINNKSNESPAIHIKINYSDYCKTCKVKVPIGGMEMHVAGKPHKKLLCSDGKNDTKIKTEAKKKAKIQMHKSKTGKTLCEICSRYIDTHNFTAHTNSMKHLNELMGHIL